MMTHLCCEILNKLQGQSLVTAESCTGGLVGAALTAIPGSSEVYKGGIICYSNFVKEHVLGVSGELLETQGAVSEAVAGEMARGVRRLLHADIAISITGLAGPGGDSYGHTVGTVFIGCESCNGLFVRKYHFSGDREQVRLQAANHALNLILECI